MLKKERIVCALDVGTTKICMPIARVQPEGGLEILSTGYARTSGLRRGAVVDLEAVSASIRKAREEAELRSGISVDWVTLGISGDHIQSFNCHGAIPIEGKSHVVTAEDVAQVIQASQSIPIPPEREVVHVLPQEFIIDNRGDIRNPLGLTGARLDVNIHVVTCDSATLQNLVNAVNKADMRVHRVILQQLASADAVLTPDERELGAAVVDIGGGMTGIALFLRNAVRFTSFIAIGGTHFTRDLAVGLRTPIEEAEIIKRESGSILVEAIGSDEVVQAPAIGTHDPRAMPRATACQFLRERALDLLELVRDDIRRSGDGRSLVTGAVLTGGASGLEGMAELASEILEMPVRQGFPHGIAGLAGELAHPVCATAIGLLKSAAREADAPTRYRGKAVGKRDLVDRFVSWLGG